MYLVIGALAMTPLDMGSTVEILQNKADIQSVYASNQVTQVEFAMGMKIQEDLAAPVTLQTGDWVADVEMGAESRRGGEREPSLIYEHARARSQFGLQSAGANYVKNDEIVDLGHTHAVLLVRHSKLLVDQHFDQPVGQTLLMHLPDEGCLSYSARSRLAARCHLVVL